jgi:5'-nucleotidase
MNIVRISWVVLIAAMSFGESAQALHIVLSNDDGFETANIRALYQELKAAGHEVILSAPVQNQSGRGGSINFLEPIAALPKDSRYRSIAAGAPGIGADPADPSVNYVNGTPAMAVLYALDVLAPRRWGRPPDLLISGPNEGNNLGALVIASGTVNNVFFALANGVPAIAVSYHDFTSRPYADLKPDAIEYENVNIPHLASGQSKTVAFAFTHLGCPSSPAPYFFEHLHDSPIAKEFGVTSEAPGIGLLSKEQAAAGGAKIPFDRRADSEAAKVAAGFVSISAIRMAPQGTPEDDAVVRRYLKGLRH